MAKLRQASAYRRIKRAYTRRSKYKSKSYIKGHPQCKVVMYDMGAKKQANNFPFRVYLVAKKSANLRHNAIEAARVAAVRTISALKQPYYLKLQVVPHHVMRENPLATGAGADRFQTGMSKSFGKPIGLSAHVKEGKVLMSLFVNEPQLETAKLALEKASKKFPIPCSVFVEKLK